MKIGTILSNLEIHPTAILPTWNCGQCLVPVVRQEVVKNTLLKAL